MVINEVKSAEEDWRQEGKIDRSLLNVPVKPHSILDSSTKKGSCLAVAPNLNSMKRSQVTFE